MKMFTGGLVTAATILLVLFSQSAAFAVAGAGAASLTFNTSSRAEAMGGAGTGLVWDANTNHWANPALLAFRPGIQYLDFSSNPAKGLDDDIVLTSKELTLGAYGVTLLLGTGPVDGVFLDMGEETAYHETGQNTGTFKTYMKSEHVGLGADFVQLAEIILGKEQGIWTRNWSLAGGYVWKDYEDDRGSNQDFPSLGIGQGTGRQVTGA
jgi:hypothetical protein